MDCYSLWRHCKPHDSRSKLWLARQPSKVERAKTKRQDEGVTQQVRPNRVYRQWSDQTREDIRQNPWRRYGGPPRQRVIFLAMTVKGVGVTVTTIYGTTSYPRGKTLRDKSSPRASASALGFGQAYKRHMQTKNQALSAAW